MAKPEVAKSARTLKAEREAERRAVAAAKAKREADRARIDALRKEQRDVARERDTLPLFSAARAAVVKRGREIGAEIRRLKGATYD